MLRIPLAGQALILVAVNSSGQNNTLKTDAVSIELA
jgi:hypothetical protein